MTIEVRAFNESAEITDTMQYFALPTKKKLKEEKFRRNIEQSFKLFNFLEEEEHLWDE